MCNKWKAIRHKHGVKCSDCHNQQQRLLALPPLPPSSPPSSSPPSTIFDRPEGCIAQLTEMERAAIITLDKVGWLHKDIAQIIPCSEKTVSLWVNRWREEHSVSDHERSGRPRCTDEQSDDTIECLADEKKFTTPRSIKKELQLDCSARTIRRPHAAHSN